MDLNNLVVHSAAAGAAAGTALPIVASIVLRPHWAASTKHWIVTTLAMLSGIATVAAQNGFSTNMGLPALLAAVGAVYGASQAAYAALWRPTGIAPAIEIKTSPARPLPDQPMIALTDPVPPAETTDTTNSPTAPPS